jgi:hypothetical protein
LDRRFLCGPIFLVAWVFLVIGAETVWCDIARLFAGDAATLCGRICAKGAMLEESSDCVVLSGVTHSLSAGITTMTPWQQRITQLTKRMAEERKQLTRRRPFEPAFARSESPSRCAVPGIPPTHTPDACPNRPKTLPGSGSATTDDRLQVTSRMSARTLNAVPLTESHCIRS